MRDIELIIRCQNGEKTAFQELISLYYSYLTNFLFKLAENKSTAEDLTQETFLKVIRSIDKFDINGKAEFSTYIVTIAKNCYIDQIRKTKHIYLADDYEEQYILTPDSKNTEETIIKKAEAEELMKALETLPIEQATAIKLKYLEGRTLIEIGEMLKAEPKTIKSRIHSGIKKLRKNFISGG